MVTSNLTANAQTLLEKRYLAHDNKTGTVETVDGMWDRIAHAAARPDPDAGAYRSFRDMMADLRFLPNSPTIMNAGREGTLSACFTFHVQDSLDHIFEVGNLAMKVLKYGGGVGYGLSALRGNGAPIASTGGKARGPVSALLYYQSIGAFVEQGGKRDGAQMGILSCEHPDLPAFIHAKDEHPERLNTFNISVAITDAWMSKAFEDGGGADPPPGPATLLQSMARSAWLTGDPGCYFIDRAEQDNPTPWLGRLESTNPCGEVPLLHAEACNLGSLNLAAYYDPSSPDPLDWARFRKDVATATRMLDNIVSINTFPDPLITEAVQRTRKIGLGVMGWADLLALNHIPYDSQEAVSLGGEIAQQMRTYADSTSKLLAVQRGRYPAWRRNPDHTCNDADPHRPHTIIKDFGVPSPEGQFREYPCGGVTHEETAGEQSYGYRNATRLCIAPTGSIAIIAGCSSGIEPHFALEYNRVMGDGTNLPTREPVMDRISGFVPKTAMEISGDWHLKHQLAWQKHVDLAVSKTINLPNNAKIADIEALYMAAWQGGAKGLTVYRDGSRQGQVLTTPPPVPVYDSVVNAVNGTVNGRVKLPRDRSARTHKFEVDGVEGYVIVGMYEDGRPGEVFLNISKEGSAIRGWADLAATFISVMLQYGVPIEQVIDKLRHSRFEPAGLTGNEAIPFATSVPDYIGHYLEHVFLGVHNEDDGHGNIIFAPPPIAGVHCPQCGSEARMQEGCVTCAGCGWSRC